MHSHGLSIDQGGGGQAAGLRRAMPSRPVQVMAVTGGKGGVGKTTISLNLAIALAQQGREVMLLDADLGLANVDVLLGMRPERNLSHVMEGSATLEEVIIEGPSGVRIIPAASGIHEMTRLSTTEHFGLISAFGALGAKLDILIVDTAAGISRTVTAFANASREILVVLCDEPASLTDAYALIKLMHRSHGRDRFKIVANQCRNPGQGRALFQKLQRVCQQYLDVTLSLGGVIPFDEYVQRAIQRQDPVTHAYPHCPAALAFKKLAAVADKWPIPGGANGCLEFFVERLIQPGPRGEEILV